MTTNNNTMNPALAAMYERAAKAARQTPNGRTSKTPKACACGCGGMTRGGTWLPGHDAKAYSRGLALARSAGVEEAIKATEQPKAETEQPETTETK